MKLIRCVLHRCKLDLGVYLHMNIVGLTGNGLSLPSNIRQYDRVYCGAACPENHENYMKQLIKVRLSMFIRYN